MSESARVRSASSGSTLSRSFNVGMMMVNVLVATGVATLPAERSRVVTSPIELLSPIAAGITRLAYPLYLLSATDFLLIITWDERVNGLVQSTTITRKFITACLQFDRFP
jgi:hypothetical protein